MATRSTIGYETPEGGYIGVYCHYDGYPDNIAPQLKQMSWEDVSLQVNRALLQSGGRCLDNCELETFKDGSITRAETQWPTCPEEYAYRKRMDGTVECLDRYRTPVPLDKY